MTVGMSKLNKDWGGQKPAPFFWPCLRGRQDRDFCLGASSTIFLADICLIRRKNFFTKPLDILDPMCYNIITG